MRGPNQNVAAGKEAQDDPSPSAEEWLRTWLAAHDAERLPLYDVRRGGGSPLIAGAARFEGLDGSNPESIVARQHELPSPEKRFGSFAGVISSSRKDGQLCTDFLRSRGYSGAVVLEVSDLEKHCPRAVVNQCPSCALWGPSPTLASLLPQVEGLLFGQGAGLPFSMLDVGAGAGRDSAFAAWRGWNVVGVDRCASLVSKCEALGNRRDQEFGPIVEHTDSAPDAPPHGGQPCGRVRGVVRTLGTNLADDAEFLRENAAQLLLVVRFLRRGVLELLPLGVLPLGFVLIEHFLTGCELLGGPMKKSQMLERGELGKLFGRSGFIVLREEELKLADGRPVVRFLAQRRQ